MKIKLSHNDKYLGKNDNFTTVDTEKESLDIIFDKIQGHLFAMVAIMLCFEKSKKKIHKYQSWKAEIIKK